MGPRKIKSHQTPHLQTNTRPGPEGTELEWGGGGVGGRQAGSEGNTRQNCAGGVVGLWDCPGVSAPQSSHQLSSMGNVGAGEGPSKGCVGGGGVWGWGMGVRGTQGVGGVGIGGVCRNAEGPASRPMSPTWSPTSYHCHFLEELSHQHTPPSLPPPRPSSEMLVVVGDGGVWGLFCHQKNPPVPTATTQLTPPGLPRGAFAGV